MKIAIIGAGLSGLSCAHELMRNGIVPTVFESKSFIGEVLDLPVICMDMFNMPISDPFKYLKKKFSLDLKPNFSLDELIMHSPNKTLAVKSHLGYIMKRGRYNDSIESQIMRSIRIPVNLNSYIDVRDIKNDFQYIVVATGTPNIAKDLNLFSATFDCTVRVATIMGDFKINSAITWVNTSFAKSAFAYLVPNSKNDARLVLVVNNVYPNELDYYWKTFLHTVNIDYEISNIIDVVHSVGHVDPVMYKNLLFCGNAGGFLDDVLGFGSMKALLSGVFAAKSIINKKNYNKTAQKLAEDIYQTTQLRKVINSFDNKNFDAMHTILGLPGIKQYVYHNPFFKATQAVRFAQLYNLFKGNN